MTFFATRACVLTGAHLMALPALLMNYDFGAERLIRNIDWTGVMARRTGVGVLLELARLAMANSAIDPGRFQIVRMRSIQWLRINVMVALSTLDPKILGVHLVVKDDFTY